MEAIRLQQVMEKDGEILMRGLPCMKGQRIEMIVLFDPRNIPMRFSTPKRQLTVQQLRQSGLIGLWKDRNDLADSAAYARQLREAAQNRPR